MAWSTRQIAELAGTTIKAVRHYHAVGLLGLPERRANGYKQYGPQHLAQLLQIRRLVDTGLSLAEISALERGEADPDQAIRILDIELAASIERLKRVRAALAVVIGDDLTGREPSS